MYNEKFRSGGGLAPYVAPNIKVEPNKEVVYDEIGNIKAIRDREKFDRQAKQDKKEEIISIVKKAVVIAGLFGLASAAVGFILNIISSVV